MDDWGVLCFHAALYGFYNCISGMVCVFLYGRYRIDRVSRKDNAGLYVRYVDFRAAERNTTDFPCAWTGEDIPFHCGISKNHSVDTACNHSAPLFRCHGRILFRAGFGYDFRNDGNGAFCMQYPKDAFERSACEDTLRFICVWI